MKWDTFIGRLEDLFIILCFMALLIVVFKIIFVKF